MPLILNGSTGVSGVDGTAATPALQGTDTNTGVFFPAADTIAFAEGGTEVMRINSAAQVEYVAGTAAAPTIVPAGDTNTGMFFPAADTIAFAEGGVEALRLNASGNAVFTGTVQTAGITTNLYPLVLGALAPASGTFVDITGIPSWARRITLMLLNVSTNGTAKYRFQLGTSAGVVTSGYTGSNTVFGTTTLTTAAQSAGFEITSDAAANTHDGAIRFSRLSDLLNTWICDGMAARTNSNVTYIVSGSISLPGALDRVRLTTANGTDSFDSGGINIMYE